MVVETCTESLETILKEKGKMSGKGESKNGDTPEMEALESQSYSGIDKEKARLFSGCFHISAITKDKTTTNSH